MIVLKNISRFYKMGKETIKAVENINLTIKDGEFISLVGSSGSGKTTLLNLIGTLDKPTSGEIIINDQNVNELSDKAKSRFRNQTIGFVFQSFNLQPFYTAKENVILPMVWSSLKAKEREQRAAAALKAVGLQDRINFYPHQLSAGQRQRVSTARALVNNPKIILADEPTGNLDTKTGTEIVQLLKKINQNRGAIVVMVTHDLSVAHQSRRIIKIQDGKIRA